MILRDNGNTIRNFIVLYEKKIQAEIKAYKRLLRKANISFETMIVFGSQVKGTAKPYSDIDLCVVSNNFGKEFRDEGATGLGETINVEHLQMATMNNVKHLVFVYPNGKVYAILLHDFLVNSYRRINKKNKATRSISIHLLKRVD